MFAKYRLQCHRVFSPMAKLMIRVGLTANAVTSLGLLFALITSYFLMTNNYTMTVLALFLTITLDGLDGLVAKMTGTTKFGDFYDAFVDRLVEIILFTSIALTIPDLAFISLFVLSLSLLVSYIPARAEVWTIGVKIRYRGIGSRAERMIVLFLGVLFARVEIALYLIGILSAIGIVQRFFITYSNLKKA